jgi:DnaK suppressor protein
MPPSFAPDTHPCPHRQYKSALLRKKIANLRLSAASNSLHFGFRIEPEELSDVSKTASPHTIYEKKLRQQQELLQRTMKSAVEQGRDAGMDDTQDVADQAVASYQKEFLFSQGTNGHAQMQLVRQALERLRDGSFGECQNCAETIGAKRLEALPWTPFCIACQEKVERGELEMPVRAA